MPTTSRSLFARAFPMAFLMGSLACVGTIARASTLDEPPASTQAAPQTAASSPETQAAPVSKGVPVPNLPIIETKKLENGLVIEDMKIGAGAELVATSTVTLHYHGTLKETGAIFDSTYERGEMVTYPLSGFIAGWQQGLLGLKPGGIRKLTVPSALGYGPQGNGPKIPPNSDLVFVVQLAEGVRVVSETEGTGEKIEGTCFAVTHFSVKTDDGKEVEKSDPKSPAIWLPGEQPMAAAIEGMKVGGKRTVSLPKELNTTPQGLPPVPGRVYGVAVTFEVELLSYRPWPPKR